MTGAAGMPALEIRGLDLAYGDRTVLRQASLTLGAGEIIGLMGPSGCGKTSLLKALAGLVPLEAPQSIIWPAGQCPRRCGMVFQEDRLLPWRTIAQNLRLSCVGLPAAERQAALSETEELLRLTGLADGTFHAARIRPGELSGGMRQRVALVRALLFGRELQLWDEPFQSLDAARRLQLAASLRRRFKQQGATVLMAGHDVADMLVMCDRVVVMAALESGADRSVSQFAQWPVSLAETRRRLDDPACQTERHALEEFLRDRGLAALAGNA